MLKSLSMTSYRFADFELDLDAQQLRLQGKPVRLERRPLDLLILLLEQHGRMVPREDIIAKLWPGNVIIDFDSGLNTLVRKVRNALGDSSEEPRFIETVAGRGYRFIAPLEEPAQAVQTAAAQSRRLSRPVMALLVALLLVAGAVLLRQFLVAEPENAETRIAVLPFENLTGDANLAYLAAGIAEETSISLTRIDLRNLSVIGVVSARALAGSTESAREVGRELDVDFVVLSSLRLDQSRIRVTSRLVRVADNAQIWSASFDRELTNVLGLQRELSIAIAEQIRLRLSPEVAATIDARQTQNPEAYALYLKGRYEWTQFQPDSVERTLRYYEQAVGIDPGYALAWAGIAHARITSTVTAEADRNSVVPSSRDALQRALEFGPNLAETQLALGSFHFFLDHDLPPAEAAARRSVSLDPNSAMSHMFLGIVLSELDKDIEARAMLRRARELDPLFPLMFANSANVALRTGELQQALEFATQAVAIDPEFWPGYLHLGGTQLALGNYPAALEAYTNAERFSGNSSARVSAARGYILARLGRDDEARDVLADLLSRSGARHVPPYYIAVVYAGLEDPDSAFQWLGRALIEKGIWCLNIARDRKLDTLRQDRRFDALLEQCGSALPTKREQSGAAIS